MNKLIKVFLACWILGALSSCATVSNSVSENKIKKKSLPFLLKKMEANRIDYTWFGAKAKVKYAGADQKIIFSALIRMQKDSLIWIKLKKMNVEGLRVRITPQSIEILNRQESSYTKKSFAFLQEEFGVDLSFSALQDLIVGNPVLYQQRKLLATISGGAYLLKTPAAQKEVLKIFLSANDFRLKAISGSENNNSIAIDYDNYEQVDEQVIPLLKQIQVEGEKESIELKMELSRIELNEAQKVSFKIPDSYRKD